MAVRAQRISRDIPDWLQPQMGWAIGSSWLLSLLFHVATAVVVWYVAQLPGCRAIRGEQIGEGGREVGIFVRGEGDGGGDDAAETGGETAVTSNSEPLLEKLPESPAPKAVPPEAPVLTLPKPSSSPPVIGAGAPPSIVQQFTEQAGVRPVGRTGGDAGAGRGVGRGEGRGSGLGSGGGGTSMFNVEAKGRRFVYVIDRSASMDPVLPAAKGELLASIQALDDQQKFQVIFFSNSPTVLKTRFGMFTGIESDRLEVLNQLRRIAAEGGTDRLPALLKGLELNPDVIYFLTDSSDPMSSADLEDVRRRNRSGAQIHCIEFGEGPDPVSQGRGARNFLHKLADMTGGKYVYLDTLGGLSR